ncbi:MAG TPA: metallophosphoesterase [Fimbriimonadaceae bacterium]|nr:metallophosphoesterase [Fimbriimonadaceae bacterium]
MMLVVALVCAGLQPAVFVVEPYLQLGPNPREAHVSVLWHAREREGWTVRTASSDGSAAATSWSVQAERRVGSRWVLRADIGRGASYEVLRHGRVVFQAPLRTLPAPDQSYRVVMMGDSGRGTAGQRNLAGRLAKAQPDLLGIAGDIAYPHGTVEEYDRYHFGVYRSLLARTISFAAPGNHDTGYNSLSRFPTGLAYYLFWSQPLNGPALATDFGLRGTDAQKGAFRQSAGTNFPRMSNYSFTFGNSHWTVIDSNPYLNWRKGPHRDWLAKTLETARKHDWSFVVFHHPPYFTGKTHAGHTFMRSIADLLARHRVDAVFSGHVHNYQRSRRIDGVIYIVTGAGGAELYDRSFENQPARWQPFTEKFIAKHSFTQLDFGGRRLTLRQIGLDGRELDRIDLQAK